MVKVLQKTPAQIAYQKQMEEKIFKALGKPKQEVPVQLKINKEVPDASEKSLGTEDGWNLDYLRTRLRQKQDIIDTRDKEIAALKADPEVPSPDQEKKIQALESQLFHLEYKAKEAEKAALLSRDTAQEMRRQRDEYVARCNQLQEEASQLRYTLKGETDHSNCKRSIEIAEQHMNRARADRDKANWYILLLVLINGFVFITIVAQFVLRYLL